MATKTNKKKSSKPKSAPAIALVNLSGIARERGITRQSAGSYVDRHESFPKPVLAHGAVLELTDGRRFTLDDPNGRTLFFAADEVAAFFESGALRQRGATPTISTRTTAPSKKKGKKAVADKPAAKKTVKKKDKTAPVADKPAKKGKKAAASKPAKKAAAPKAEKKTEAAKPAKKASTKGRTKAKAASKKTADKAAPSTDAKAAVAARIKREAAKRKGK